MVTTVRQRRTLSLINHRTHLCLARPTQASGLDQSEFVSKYYTTKKVST